MSSFSFSGSVFWLRMTLAVPVSVATLPIGSSEAAGWAEEGGCAEGADGAGEGAGVGCACDRRTVVVPAGKMAPLSVVGNGVSEGRADQSEAEKHRQYL